MRYNNKKTYRVRSILVWEVGSETFAGNSSATKAQRHKEEINYKTLSKREESIAEKLQIHHIPFIKNGIK